METEKNKPLTSPNELSGDALPETPRPPGNAERAEDSKGFWSDQHPVFLTCAFIAAAIGVIGGSLGIYQFVRDDVLSPTHFVVDGCDVRIVNRDGKTKLSENLSNRTDWTVFAKLEDADTENAAQRLIIGMGSEKSEENEIISLDKSLHTRNVYKFCPDCPIPQIHKDVVLASLQAVQHKGKRYYVAIFHGIRFPTAVVILDDSLREVGTFWHTGHLYGMTYLNGLLYFWGKNNTFMRGRDLIQPDPKVDVMTLNHVVVFALPFESIAGTNNHGPWLGPRGARIPQPVAPTRPTPQPQFAFYYLLDILSEQFSGPTIDAKPAAGTVVFTSDQRWRYEFGPSGRIGEPEAMPSHSPEAAPLIEILPHDKSGELQPPTMSEPRSDRPAPISTLTNCFPGSSEKLTAPRD